MTGHVSDYLARVQFGCAPLSGRILEIRMNVFIQLIVPGTRFANRFHQFKLYLPQMEEGKFGAGIRWRTIGFN